MILFGIILKLSVDQVLKQEKILKYFNLIIALISIYFVTRKKLQQPIIGLIRNSNIYKKKEKSTRYTLNKFIIILSYTLVILVIFYSFLTSLDQNASLILSAGAIFLLGSIVLLNSLLSTQKYNSVSKSLITLFHFVCWKKKNYSQV